jgi:hypothetical protein
MKSKLFQKDLDKKIFDDLLLFAKIDDEHFNDIVRVVEENSQNGQVPTDDDFLEIASKSNYSVGDLNKVFRVAIFLVAQELEKGDVLENIYNDLLTDSRFDNEIVSKVKFKINNMRPGLINIINHSNKRAAIEKTFPSLSFFAASCSISTRFEPVYNIRKDNVENFKCELAEAIPVAVIQLDVDHFGESKSFNFALDEDELDELIKNLKVAKIQMSSLNNSLKKIK